MVKDCKKGLYYTAVAGFNCYGRAAVKQIKKQIVIFKIKLFITLLINGMP